MKKIFTFLSVVIWTFSLVELSAQNISLDQTFGTNGIYIEQLSPYGSAIREIEILPDGKIIAAGEFETLSGYDILVAKFNQNGNLDLTSFAPNGFFNFDTGLIENETIEGLTVDSEGNIYIAGNFNNGANLDLFILKLDSNGTPDVNFGTNGFFLLDVYTFDDYLIDIIVQSDGKILACGSANNGTNDYALVLRLNSDGTLDISFGTGGMYLGTYGSGNFKANVITKKVSGEYVFGGEYHDVSSDGILIAQLLDNGSLDNAFNTNGYLLSDLSPSGDFVYDLKFDNNGKIVVAGCYNETFSLPDDSQFFIARLFDNGVFDATFDTDGIATSDFGPYNDQAYALAIQTDNKYLVGGYTWTNTTLLTSDFAIVRFNWDGQPDNTFDLDGSYTLSLGTQTDQLLSIALQPDGKIIAAGASMESSIWRTALIKLQLLTIPEQPVAFDTSRCGAGDITLQAQGGQVGEKYKWYDSSVGGNLLFTDSVTTNGMISYFTNNLSSTTTYFVALDSAGVESPRSMATAYVYSQATLGFSSVNNTSCGLSNGSATCIPSGGTSPYSYLWENSSTTATSLGLSFGFQSVTVTDANFCESIDSVLIANSTGYPTSTVSSQTNLTCFGDNNGSATIMSSGGVSPYSYLWNNGQTSNIGTNLSAGNYSVTVTGSNSCSNIIYLTITEPAQLQISKNVTNVNCFGLNAGVIDITPSGGFGPYSYLWSNGSTFQDIGGLAAGVYTITLTDNNACTITDITTITQPAAALALSLTANHISCYSYNDGSITANTSGGTSPYSILWSNSSNTNTITNLSQGVYSATVTDANGCTKSSMTNIIEPNQIIVNAGTDQSVSGSSVTLNGLVSGGSSTGIWTSSGTGSFIPSNTNLVTDYFFSAADMVAGFVTLTLTSTNNGGCSPINDAINITIMTSLSASFNVSNAYCGVANSGAIDITVSGGSAPYTYLWSNSFTNEDLSGISAGLYYVTITDALSSTYIDSVIVESLVNIPDANFKNYLVNNFSINSNMDSEIQCSEASAYVGTLNVAFKNISDLTGIESFTNITSLLCYNNNLTSIDISNNTLLTNLHCGGNQLSSLDLSNNLSIESIDCGVNLLTNLNTSLNTNLKYLVCSYNQISSLDLSNNTLLDSLYCNNNQLPNIDISLNGDLKVFWCNNNLITSLDVTNNPLIEEFDCSNNTISSLDLSNNLNLKVIACYNNQLTNLNTSSNILLENILCYDNVLTDLDFSNNTSLIDIECNNNSLTSLNIKNGNYTNLAWFDATNNPNLYCVEVDDTLYMNSNWSSAIDIQTEYNEFCSVQSLSMTYNSTNISCFGNSDGAIDITVTGGTSPYTYLWSNGFTSEDLSNLVAGIYFVTITDALSNTLIDSVEVYEPTELIPYFSLFSHITCNGANDGQIIANADGGTQPYTFLWNNTIADTIISNLSSAYYEVAITDANGCFKVIGDTIQEPAELVVWFTEFTHISCNGANDGQIIANADGGTQPYTFLWNNTVNDTIISNLVPAFYEVSVIDNNGCNSVLGDTILEPTLINIWFPQYSDVTCFGANNGFVYANVDGGTQPYNFQWSNGYTNDSIIDLSADNYYVTVTDNNGCESVNNIIINEPDELLTLISTTDESCSGMSDGAANVNVMGGISPYTFLWSNSETTDSIINLTSGVYSITVTDSNGCVNISSDVINPAISVNINETITNIQCNGLNNGMISIAPSGGMSPYTIIWSNSSTNNTISSLDVGNYSVTVTDNNNCFSVGNYNISQPAAISATIVKTPTTCDLSCNGTATITASGGTSPYSFYWSNGEITNPALSLCPGINTFTITDANACNKVYNVQILTGATSSITGTVNYSGGLLPVNSAIVQLWKNSTNNSSGKVKIAEMNNINNGIFTFSNLLSGTYFIKVKVIEQTSFPNLLPTYYDSVHQWFNASQIILACDTSINISVNMMEIPSAQAGLGNIYGRIYRPDFSKSILGEPVPGADITLEQEPDDEPVVATETNYQGNYNFNNIGNGTYTIKVDIPGIPQFETDTITFTGNDTTYYGINFIVDTSSANLGIYFDPQTYAQYLGLNINSLYVFPNPFKDLINIKFNLSENSKVSFELIDMSGKKVFVNEEKQYFKGENNSSINIENLLPGAYLLKYRSNNNFIIKRIIKVD